MRCPVPALLVIVAVKTVGRYILLNYPSKYPSLPLAVPAGEGSQQLFRNTARVPRHQLGFCVDILPVDHHAVYVALQPCC